MNVESIVQRKVAAAQQRAARVARQGPGPVRAVHCPACRRERVVRAVGSARVRGGEMRLVQCPERSCELIWAVHPGRGAAAA